MNSDKKVLTRFAPSPTGDLHLGNARSAILNWIYAKKNYGEFILRIDDTDTERSKDKYVDSIKNDLLWLKINWSSSFKQSERLKNYNTKILELKGMDRLYPCFETAEELALKRKSLLSSGKPPIYDRSSLKLTDKEKEDFLLSGKKPHWRFFVEDKTIIWNDIIRGDVSFDSKNLSDPILIRENGSLLYHLPSVIDDITENVTDIIRGEDHVNNTAFHIQLFESLGSKPPNFGHHPLITDESGKSLGKRLGSLSIKSLSDDGLEPISIINYLSTIGTSKDMSSKIELNSILESFDIKSLARSSPKFNKKDLIRINSNVLKKMKFDNAQEALSKLGIKDIKEEFWNLIKNNIEFMHEANEWIEIISSSKILYNSDKDFLDKCSSVLPKEPFTINTWEEWLVNIDKISDRKGKKLFMPLRLALTGREHGPELKYLIPLMTKKLILFRLGK
ncbi:MAG: Glutamate--tRNA ligase 1 [Alphaproteobacteria bacterium MarineAlpha5_Bin11]|nr:glutamate--tRNA ligase [Pelagibacteraceae bacterium]PPR43760.1 MAG: Glutamate--tRNA ligase 1 [Alphaproteobacteria bacterium MarineAlpha5_Bin11]PPR51339.1 MAG: Glutamate--tRNA ligase 1 [Alphaproteobacteria bacterium MarineAlpha5_Bin10]|tara:strand:+ start:20328 stop:21671 length:1344 start_codon:yes stop_codon:yes gene_type:complete